MQAEFDAKSYCLNLPAQPGVYRMLNADGEAGAIDLIAAHKWFNLAALRGYADAAWHRQQIAEEMTPAEIATAQRAAREWLRTH